MGYALIKDLTTVNYTKGNSGRKYIVLHYTGNKTDTAKNNAGYFRSVNRGASAHYFVDKTTVYQVVADENTSWAIGKNYGSGNLFSTVKNNNSINIEMCSDGGKIASETFANVVALTKELMKKYNIPAGNVYRHYDVCSKQCPGWTGWVGSNQTLWNTFKTQIGTTSPSTPPSTDTPAPNTSPSPSPSANTKLTVDGMWGNATTKRLQEILKTPVDGVVSSQYVTYKKDNPGLVSGWDWKEKPSKNGSALIKAIQKLVGATQDGFIGSKTITAMQQYWGTVQDGKISKPSALVKAIQAWCNSK